MSNDSTAEFVARLRRNFPRLRQAARQFRSNRLRPMLGISDIVQETAFRLTRNRRRLPELSDAALSLVAKKTAFRVVVDFVRRSPARRFLAARKRRMTVQELARHASTARDTSVSDKVARLELQQIALAVIHQLPPDYRAVIRMRYLESQPFTAIAESTGRSVDSVQKLHARAIERLRDELDWIDGFIEI